MNWYIFLSRFFHNLAHRCVPAYDRTGALAWTRRKLAYNILFPLSQLLQERGERKFLFVSDHSNAGREMREQLFRRFRLFVEGYIANTAHRITDAPKEMPLDIETRQKWGLRHLEELAEEYDEEYGELARIYKWLIEDRQNWQNPYWDKAPTPDFSMATGFIPDDKKAEWEYWTSRAERYDRIHKKRTEDRGRRLYSRKDLLLYD